MTMHFWHQNTDGFLKCWYTASWPGISHLGESCSSCWSPRCSQTASPVVFLSFLLTQLPVFTTRSSCCFCLSISIIASIFPSVAQLPSCKILQAQEGEGQWGGISVITLIVTANAPSLGIEHFSEGFNCKKVSSCHCDPTRSAITFVFDDRFVHWCVLFNFLWLNECCVNDWSPEKTLEQTTNYSACMPKVWCWA